MPHAEVINHELSFAHNMSLQTLIQHGLLQVFSMIGENNVVF